MIAPVTFPLFQPLYPFFSTTLPSTSPNYLTPPPKQSPPPLHIQRITDVSSNPKLSQYKISYSHSPSHSHSSSTPSLHTTTLPFPSLPASTPLPPPPPLHIQLVTNFSSKHIPLATSTQPIYPTPPPPSSSDCRVAKMPVKTARRCWIPMHTIGKLVAGGGSSVIRQGTPPSFNHPLSFSQTLPSTPPNYLTPPPPPKQPPQPPQPSPPPLHVQLVTDVSSNP